MNNVLSVDVEDYFHVEAFASVISRTQWDSHEKRVDRNVYAMLDLFAKYQTRATFFVLGWVAERFPDLVREIAAAGHEIGSHGYGHQRLMILRPDEFRLDLRRSIQILSDLVQKPIHCYRAPSFSIVKQTFWALDILVEEGISHDSSMFPIRHDVYGVPDGRRFVYVHTTASGSKIVEFPPSTIRLARNNWGVAGGGYLRFSPYPVTRRALHYINTVESQPGMVYVHPWEIDPGQPTIRTGFRSRLRHYTNLHTMHQKLESLLQHFHFDTLTNVCGQHVCTDGVSASS